MVRFSPTRTAALVALALVACADQADDPAAPATLAFSGIGEHGGGPPGSIVYTHRPPSGTPVNLWIMDADGGNQYQLTFSLTGTANITPDWSPDGKRIAFTSTRNGSPDIFVMNRDGSGLMQLTAYPGTEQGPVWSPNGKQLTFYSNHDGDFEIYVMDADGSNIRQITDYSGVDQYPDYSPNGQQIAFQRDGDIFLVDLRDLTTTLVWDAPFFSDMPEFSPNGKRLVFMSQPGPPTGGCHVYMIDVDGGNLTDMTPRPAGAPLPWCNFFPSWSANGQHIYFGANRSDVTNDAEIYVINVDGTGLTRLTDQPGMNSAAVMR